MLTAPARQIVEIEPKVASFEFRVPFNLLEDCHPDLEVCTFVSDLDADGNWRWGITEGILQQLSGERAFELVEALLGMDDIRHFWFDDEELGVIAKDRHDWPYCAMDVKKTVQVTLQKISPFELEFYEPFN